MRVVVAALGAAGIFLCSFSTASIAEMPPVSPAHQQAYQRLDTWLRIEEFNRRCHVLHYFEAREVATQVQSAVEVTPEGDEVAAAIGRGGFEAKLARREKMRDEHRAKANAVVKDLACNASPDDVRNGRNAYFYNYLRQLTASQNSSALANERAGRRQARDTLVGLISQFYGSNFQTAAQKASDELQTANFDPNNAWNQLTNPINDILWQIRIKSKGFTFQDYPNALGYYKAVKIDGSGELPAKLGHRFHPNVLDATGNPIRINQTEGVTDDGRVIILVSKDSADWGSQEMKAVLYTQKEAGLMVIDKDDWRSVQSTRYDAELLPNADCPTDFCFVFPKAASDEIKSKRFRKDKAYYNFELVIGDAGLFPLGDQDYRSNLNKYYPPQLPGETPPRMY